MRQLIGGLLVALLAPAFLLSQATLSQATAPPSKNVYVVSLIDVIPRPEGLGEVNNLLLRFAADSRKDPGVVRFDVVVQDGRPNHFVLLEVWKSRGAFEAHSAAAHTRTFREKLQPALGSPFDERLNVALQ